MADCGSFAQGGAVGILSRCRPGGGMVDAADLKSVGSNAVRVRVPPRARESWQGGSWQLVVSSSQIAVVGARIPETMSDRTFITGFGPFGEVPQNPSGLLAERSGRQHQVLEVSYSAADRFLGGWTPDRFDRLILLGVAAKSKLVRLEMVARNRSSETPDLEGRTLSRSQIEPGAPESLPTTLWEARWIDDLSEHVELSNDAGGYLCNYVYYRALQRFPNCRIGFLHVPALESMPLELQEEALGRLIARTEELSSTR